MPNSPSTAPLIDIHNATVRRGGNTIFDGLTLRIDQGQSTAVIGANGAGKTTLLRLLTRELYPAHAPDSWVRILGRERFSVWDLRRDIGMVSHELQYDFFSRMSGWEVVLSGFTASIGLRGVPHEMTPDMRARAAACLARIGVSELCNVAVEDMSTGQQRRVLLARALVHEPDALVLDEPMAGLDPGMTIDVGRILTDLVEAGKTVVLATHHINEIPAPIERVVLLKKGRVLADSDKRTVLTAQTLSELYDTKVKVVEADGHFFPVAG